MVVVLFRALLQLVFETVGVLPLTGCTNESTPNITNPHALKGKAAVFLRGDCLFSVKILAAHAAGAAAVVVVNTPDTSMTVAVAANVSEYKLSDIPVVMVPAELQQLLFSGTHSLAMFVAKPAFLDVNSIVFLFLALACVLTGTWWSTADERSVMVKSGQHDDDIVEHGRRPHASKAANHSFTIYHIGGFVVLASVFIISLFFWFKVHHRLLLFFFCPFVCRRDQDEVRKHDNESGGKPPGKLGEEVILCSAA